MAKRASCREMMGNRLPTPRIGVDSAAADAITFRDEIDAEMTRSNGATNAMQSWPGAIDDRFGIGDSERLFAAKTRSA